MPRGKPKQTPQQPLQGIPADRPGLPAIESIQSVECFVAPDQAEYQILHTTETDAYDEPPKPKRAPRPRKTG